MYQGFAGHFDGQGHTVYGMYYRTYKEKYAYGLIPRANGNAVISNVNVRYAYAAPNNNVDVYMGGILGCVDLAPGNKASVITVSKCVVDNTVNFSDLANCHVGGIIGCGHYAKITVEYCGSAAKFNDYGKSRRQRLGRRNSSLECFGNILSQNCQFIFRGCIYNR